MKPWKTVATAVEAGSTTTLKERDGEFLVQVGGKVLMGSRRHGSEEALAELGCAGLRERAPRVLVGGLGFGYTLRAALDLLPPSARVVVAEVSHAVVEWNRGPLSSLAGAPLADPRVEVEVADVSRVLEARPAAFDAVLLDVDNGPFAISRSGNARLYQSTGVERCRRALRPGGVLAVWSAGEDPSFERRLAAAGFEVKVAAPRAAPAQGARHVVFLGRVSPGRR